MEVQTGCENMFTSTPKANASKNMTTERHERKTLGTLQAETVPESKHHTPLPKCKDTVEGKHKTKVYYGEVHFPSTPHLVKVYEDKRVPDKSSITHCSRGCQTDPSLLNDLIQKELENQITDPNDSGRVSGFINQEVHDLIAKEEISEHYWKDLAEERRRALKEALSENEKLSTEIDLLKEENNRLSQIAVQAQSLRDMLDGMISDDDPEESVLEQDSALSNDSKDPVRDKGQQSQE
ncbi:uncharacterized protein LOC106062363 [Biomphalaria glabrata]|uniref:Uncharacterized protein LOC106062363 n=1 Tax=Biomphalaria glabrata TaxID=6526 RepID=A0A9W3AFW7_BIOGL|nr:uncharacterized protein LOC106062363 [Biomphalaria glabrata]